MASRPGATPAVDLPVMRQLMPLILPSRTHAVIFYQTLANVEGTLSWIEANNSQDAAQKVSLFQVLLTAIVRTLADRPQLNRYVKGGRIWQRDHVALTFSVKQARKDSARIVSTKLRFDEDIDIFSLGSRVHEAVNRGRSGKKTSAETTIRRLLTLPRPLAAPLLWARHQLDEWGLMPASALEFDPLYTSAMVSNVGSFGLSAVYHHPFEDGTCSINVSMGRVAMTPVALQDGTIVARKTLDLRFTLDDRICDGFYYARTLALLQWFIENPQVLAVGRTGVTEPPALTTLE